MIKGLAIFQINTGAASFRVKRSTVFIYTLTAHYKVLQHQSIWHNVYLKQLKQPSQYIFDYSIKPCRNIVFYFNIYGAALKYSKLL